jgi:predicted dehydrogenase
MRADGEGPTMLPRLGFLGLGQVGRHRLEAIAHAGIAEIVAIADPDLKAAAAAQVLMPSAVIRRGLNDLLVERLDGLVIAAPASIQAEAAVEALRKGVAVLCQPPLGRRMVEASQVLEAARTSDRLLELDLPHRSIEGLHRIQALIQEGALGPVREVHLNCWIHPDAGMDASPSEASSFGSSITESAHRLLDLALWTLRFPPVTSIDHEPAPTGQTAARVSGAADDLIDGRISLADGCLIRITCAKKAQAEKSTSIEASFVGTHGSASLRNADGSTTAFAAEWTQGTTRHQLMSPTDDWQGRAALEWAARLATDTRFDPSIEHAVTVLDVMERLQEPSEK